MMNNGHGMGGFHPPNGNARMMNPNWHSGPPRHNRPCPWGPPQPPQQQRPNFNINTFMHPPHAHDNASKPSFIPDDIFGSGAPSIPQPENFPFTNPQNGNQGPGPQFRGHPPGRGRGFMTGGRGGQSFRGHQRGRFGGQQSDRGGYNGAHSSHGGFGGSQPNLGGKKKKERVNKRDLPQNNAYFCDTCDRGFKTEEKYKEHIDGHMKCSHKDCPYIAAPKLVQLHMRMQHRAGIAKRIWSMESAEDVKKWREDRKRNYPTAENIAQKKKEQAERVARGEVLETRDFSKMRGGRGRDRGRGRRGGRGRGRDRWRDYDRDHSNKPQARSVVDGGSSDEDDDDDDDSPPEEIKIKRSGSQDRNLTASMEETANTEAKKLKLDIPATSTQHTGGLALLASYGDSSSDSELSEGEEEAEITKSGSAVMTASGTTSPVKQKNSTVGTAQSQTTTAASSKISDPLPNPFATVSSETTSPTAVSHEKTVSDDSVVTANDSNVISVDDMSANSVANDNEHVNITGSASVTNGCSQSMKTNSDAGSNSGASGKAFHKQGRRGNRKRKKSGNNEDLGSDNKEAHTGPMKCAGREPRGEQGDGPSAKKKKMMGKPQPQLRKYTLLEKLLAPDIRRERNKILQCVYYIVKNKFFETDLTSTSPTAVGNQEATSAVTASTQ